MELLKVRNKVRFSHHGGSGSHSIRIRFPDHRFLRVLSRSLLFSVMLLSLPCIGSLWRECSSESAGNGPKPYSKSRNGGTDSKFLDLILQDLINEGLLKRGNSVLVLAPKSDSALQKSRFLNANEAKLVMVSYSEDEISSINGLFDVVTVLGSQNWKIADHFVRIGGLLVSQSDNLSASMETNYKVVYLRGYESTIVAMRKTKILQQEESSTGRKLFHVGV